MKNETADNDVPLAIGKNVELDTNRTSDLNSSLSADIPHVSEAEPPTEDEIRAARTIQGWYRRAQRRCQRGPSSNLFAVRSRFFAACLEAAQVITWSKESLYRLLFLGPLPHILLCLDLAVAGSLAEKSMAKKELPSATHEMLDDVSSRLTRIGTTHKSLLRLQKALDPTAMVHVRRDHEELKRYVQEAVDLLGDMPFSIPQDFGTDLDIAFKGIVKEKPEKAKTKPSVQLDDDFGMYSDDDEKCSFAP